jgi:putative ABC transport system permease protein
MSARAPWLLRRLAALLIRGPEAPYVLVDLDDTFDREITRGMSLPAAQLRYVVNTFLSAIQVLRGRFAQSSFRLSWIDVRLGLRMLVKHPTLTLVALFALAVALPVTLAPMHMALAVESNLPEDPAGRLQLLRLVNGTTNVNDLHRWRAGLTSFDQLAGVRQANYNVELHNNVEAVQGAEVSAAVFPMLGTAPAVGRTLTRDDEVPGAESVVLIGHQIWQTSFGGRADIIGTPIRIGGVPHRIVGVMPEQFYFPARQQIWLPLRDQLTPTREDARDLRIIGHLRDAVSADAAQAEFTTVALAGVRVEPGERLVPEVVPTSFLMFNFPKGGFRATTDFQFAQVLTIVPLLIACLNVGLLIFARTAARASEFSVRTALGASRSRILTQVFTESFVLVMLATGLGLWLLHWVPERALTMMGVTLPYWINTGVTMPIVGGGLVMAVFAAGIAGVIPVWRTTNRSIHQTMQKTRAGKSGVRFGGLSTVLIVADVAVAVAVIGLATGIGRQIDQTRANEGSDGITAARFLSFTLQQSTRMDTQDVLVDRLKAEPGVRGVAVATVLPRMEHPTTRIELAEGASRLSRARWAEVDPEFFTELRQPLLAGRGFTTADLLPSANTAIVNTSFVSNVLGGTSPIGQRVRFLGRDDAAEPGPWLEIVGVVGHLGMRSVNADFDTGIYRPLAPGTREQVRVAVEVAADPLSFVPRLREITWAVDPEAVVSAIAPLSDVYEGDWYVMAAAVAGGLVLVGVLLTMAVSAIYAIMSFTVAQRTREIGVRVALGADRMQVVMQVARRALVQIAIGVLLGMVLTGTLLFEILREANPTGSPRLAIVLALLPGIGILVVIALASCAGPTLRALRISPVEALRHDG